MNRQQRMRLFEGQARAFTTGIVEYINNQWVFFDEETEEASSLDEYLHQEIEVFNNKCWKKGILFEEGKLGFADDIYKLKNQDTIRIKKHLIYSLERLLEDLHDDAFIHFITTLNSLKFSIFDCIYCYNHLTFLNKNIPNTGVNFLVFDNQELICTVQHHFTYYEKSSDRFEFTLNSGKRLIIEKIS
ncbi:DUF2777 domain-containing protein [Bacillus marasmi]|uniref:DUF2777 domain-containing protein n=1 Tax=Bacillus marasmi TaxID=1926279 RepID=UPI0011C7F4FA|nr:DUF2777 domain-containing protein [Bacillus marasmi]